MNETLYLSFGGRQILPEMQRLAYGDPYGSDPVWDFGYIDPARRTAEESGLARSIDAAMPRFHISGRKSDDPKKAFLWEAAKKCNGGQHFLTFRQVTGSCVGNGLGQALRITAACDAVIRGEPEDGAKMPFWLLAYGWSRQIMGARGRGEGSFGGAAAQAAREKGFPMFDVRGLPSSDTSDGICYGRATELEWSYGPQQPRGEWDGVALKHLVRTTAKCNSHDDVREALRNGYACTQASMWGGLMKPAVQDGVLLNRRADRWSHQMCAPKGTLIVGPVTKKAEDIAVGDVVYGHDGKEHAITEVFVRRHIGPMVRIGVIGKQSLELTPNHPVLVFRRSLVRKKIFASATVGVVEVPDGIPGYVDPSEKRFDPVWVNAGDVRPGDYLVTPQITYDGDPVVPEWVRGEHDVKVIPDITTPDSELAWLFGFYVGDGNVRKGHGINFTLGLDDPLDRLLSAVRRLGVEPKVTRHDTYIRVRVDSVILERSFREWFGNCSAEKKFPAWMFQGWDLEAALDGLLEADGCSYKGRRVFTTVSRVLAEQVRLILASMGQFCTVCNKDNSGGTFANAAPMVELTWRPGSNDHRFRCRSGFVLYKVKSVLLTHHDGDVFNYEVEGSHSYVANGFAVHNCIIGWWDHPSLGELFYVLNSWGPQTHGVCPTGAPPGGFWVKAADMDFMCADEVYALSQWDGFPAQTLDWLW